jgi:hypothetical protein
VGFSLIDDTRLANANFRRTAGPVLVQAGRRVDAPDAPAARLPPANVDVVRQRIRTYFGEAKPDFLVTSAACETDLLALEMASQLNIKRVVLCLRTRQASGFHRWCTGLEIGAKCSTAS